MGFLFGDLSPAPFVTNFLEELRDAIDFAGGIAEADQTITTADARREEARKRAEAELTRLEALAWTMIAAAEASDRGSAESASARLAAELGMLVNERRDVADAAVRTKLEEEIIALDGDVVAAHEDYFPTLRDWLLAREPPKAKHTWRVELIVGAKKDSHRYRAMLDGESEIGLTWTLELAIPGDGVWAAPLRVSRLAENLAIVTPQLTGLIKKEVKSKKQKVDRHWITGVADDGETMVIELSAEIGDAEGFIVTAGASTITVERLGREADPTVGTFPVAPEDEPALHDLASSVREAVRALPKQRLESAAFDGVPFDGRNLDAQWKLVQVVPRLVDSLAPMVDEIASRSRSDAELVLRRQSDDGRREELFMPKARLSEKFSSLDAAHQQLFASVTRALSPKVPSDPAVKAATAELRSEIAPPEPPYVKRRSSGSMNAVVAPLLKERQPTYSSPDLEIGESEEEIEESGSFSDFQTLFGSPAFASTRPDEQRAALRQMFFGKQPDIANDEVKSAYRATLPILQALIIKDHDPADYEMLGMAYVVLDEPQKALEIFRKALDAERSRNPTSDLCESLMRRVSQL